MPRTRIGQLVLGLIMALLVGRIYLNWRHHANTKRMFVAVVEGNAATLKQVLEAGTDVNALQEGRSSLWLALNHDHLECAQLLLAHGARIMREPTANHRTELMAAANGTEAREMPTDSLPVRYPPEHERAEAAIVRSLLKQGAPVNGRDDYAYTALHYAAQRGHIAVVQELLEQGAQVNAQSWYGVTPLFLAIECDQPEIARLLLAYGADVKRPAMTSTPLQLARKKKNALIVQMLRQAGAKR